MFSLKQFSCLLGTFCGVFRRQALDRGAMLVGANKIVTGTVWCSSFVFCAMVAFCNFIGNMLSTLISKYAFIAKVYGLV